MHLTSDERVLFAQAVWSEFEKRRGWAGEMSSAEFDLVYRWIKRGIPLPVVLRGIEECGGKSGKPRTLHYCAQAVERAFEYWVSAAGLTGAAPTEEWGPERIAAERQRILAGRVQ